MTERDYDYNTPYEPEKTVKGGGFIRGAVIAALLGATAIGGTYMMTQTPAQDETPVAANEGAYQVANTDPASMPDTGYNNTAPAAVTPPAQTAEAAPAPARRAAPRPAAPAEPAPPPVAAEPEFTPSAPPELPAPANPDMTIPDVIEPLPPTNGQ